MRDVAVLDVPANLGHLEPVDSTQRLGGAPNAFADRIVDAQFGRPDDLCHAVNVVCHVQIVGVTTGPRNTSAHDARAACLRRYRPGMDVADALDHGLDFFGDTVRAVGTDQWTSPTPCEDWNSRELLGHVLGVMQIAVQMMRGDELGGSLAPVEVGADPVDDWERTAATVRAEVAAVDLTAERETVLGTRPVSFSLTFPSFDLYLHAWDLGHAAGRPVRIPDDVVTWIDGFLRQLPEDRMRGPNTFGPEQPAPPDADLTSRLMAFTGRVVV